MAHPSVNDNSALGTPLAEIVLRPSSPALNPRYNLPLRWSAGPTQTLVKPFALLQSAQTAELIADGWYCYVHPEGLRYFYHPSRRIVTTTDPRLEQGRTIDAAWAMLLSQLHTKALGADFKEAIEFHLEAYDDSNVVDYYGVDFSRRSLFWVEQVDGPAVGLNPCASEVELRGELTTQFWMHVEYFPNHLQVDKSAESELLSILRFSVIDGRTAPGATGPYSAEECKEYDKAISGLVALDNEVSKPYRIATVARLMSAIVRTRNINGWGGANPRMDRLQGEIEYLRSQLHPNLWLFLGEAACLFSPRKVLRRLTSLWVGRIVYERHWRVFLHEMQSEWLGAAVAASAIWCLNVGVTLIGSKMTTARVVSTALALLGTLVSLALCQSHSRAELAHASDISNLIVRAESAKHGLRPLSIVYSIPRSLAIWSAIILQTELIFLSRHPLMDWVVPALSVACLFAFVGGFQVISTDHKVS